MDSVSTANHESGGGATQAAAGVEVKTPFAQPRMLVMYAVCVGRHSELGGLRLGAGFEANQAVVVERIGELAAVAIALDAAYFSGSDAEERLAELSWVAPRAIRHEELVRSAMERGPVLPLPFGTLFSSAEVLAERVRRMAGAIDEYLARVEGCVEMGLRLTMDRPRAVAAYRDRLAAERPLPASPGARYLAEKKLSDEANRAIDGAIGELCDRVVEPLEELGRGMVRRRSTAARDDGRETAGMYAILMPRGAEEEFEARLAAVRAEGEGLGLSIEVTGPWPPYSFSPALGERK